MESWDDRLGTHVHDDATLKPAGQVLRDLATLIRTIRLADFDTSSGRVSTDRGELLVKLKEVGNSQSYSLYHASGSRCFAAMSQNSAQWEGKQLVSGPSNSYVYILSDDGSDLLADKRTYANSEAPAKLMIYGRSVRPRSVSLVDVSPLGIKSLETPVWSSGPEGVEIAVDPTLQAYWIQVER